MFSYMKCTLCDVYAATPIHISEPNAKGVWETAHLCESCSKQYLAETPLASATPIPTKVLIDEKNNEVLIDVSHVKSSEELLAIIAQHQAIVDSKPPCPKCGLTIKDFDLKGKFGCAKCYDHFTERMEELVYPYHKGAKNHIGKSPKSKLLGDRLKTLKLQMAHAIETERYEKAAEIKREIEGLSGSPELPSVS